MTGPERAAKYANQIGMVFPDGEDAATVLTALQYITVAILNDFDVPTALFAERVEGLRAAARANGVFGAARSGAV